jgi:Fe-S-cluster containining protein
VSYPCTACGACCRRVGAVLASPMPPEGTPHARARAEFPYQARPDGSCEQLTEGGTCAVYADRPLLCSVDRMRALHEVPEPLYYALSAAACNRMQADDGLPAHFRVILSPSATLPPYSDD